MAHRLVPGLLTPLLVALPAAVAGLLVIAGGTDRHPPQQVLTTAPAPAQASPPAGSQARAALATEHPALPESPAEGMPDLRLEALDLPAEAEATGFTVRAWMRCDLCHEAITASASLRIEGLELPRRAVTFQPERPTAVSLTWWSGPLPAGASIRVLVTIDPENRVTEPDKGNNSLLAQVLIIAAPAAGEHAGHRWGSRLID